MVVCPTNVVVWTTDLVVPHQHNNDNALLVIPIRVEPSVQMKTSIVLDYVLSSKFLIAPVRQCYLQYRYYSQKQGVRGWTWVQECGLIWY